MSLSRLASLPRAACVVAPLALTSALVHCGSDQIVHEQTAGEGMTATPMDTLGPPPGTPGKCTYTDDKSFCACLGNYDCGGIDSNDTMGINYAVYCGSCPAGKYCKAATPGDGFGHCDGTNPIVYEYQRQKINMLVAMGENDSPLYSHASIVNLNDGRGYTISTTGFTTGTGDFILVAACYNDLKPKNVLSKYWGHRDSSGRAIDGLIYYNDLFVTTGLNQPDTSRIDQLGDFKSDVLAAAIEPDGIFVGCEDAMAANFYLSAAAQHADERGLRGPLTIGFLYDTEINFGDDPDVNGTPGAKIVMARADADYGPGLPKDFTGMPWEESRWLGYLIRERTIVMSKDMTWLQDMDQDATWEGARRLHTAATNMPETGTDLSMDFDFVSQFKAGSAKAGGPCWADPPLASTWDTENRIWVLSTDKSANPTDPTTWGVKLSVMQNYAPCPTNPTP
jgi:hypothetical protein